MEKFQFITASRCFVVVAEGKAQIARLIPVNQTNRQTVIETQTSTLLGCERYIPATLSPRFLCTPP